MLQLNAQNELISNLMPPTGFKIVGTGVYHGVASLLFTKQFEDVCASRLWVSEVLVLEFGPILPDIGFQLLKSSWSSLKFFVNDAPNVTSLGERRGLQAGQFSTQTLLIWSHAVLIAAVCCFALSRWNTQGLHWNRRHLGEHMLL